MTNIKKIAICLTAVIFAIAATKTIQGKNYEGFPEDFYFDGKIIDPFFVKLHLTGVDLPLTTPLDSSIDSSLVSLGAYDIHRSLDINLESKTAKVETEYTIDLEEDEPLSANILESYRLLDSHKKKHILLLKYDDSLATGRFQQLQIVERTGDSLTTHRILATGDRAFGGVIAFESLKNGVFVFVQIAQPEDIYREIADIEIEHQGSPREYGDFIRYRIDLEKEDAPIEVYGLELNQYAHRGEDSYSRMANDRIKEGATTLSLEEARTFLKEAIYESPRP